MIARLKKLLSEEDSGATALEFAVILPVLVYFLFGIMDIALMLITSLEVNAASDIALRQIRTGELQTSVIPSTYAGYSNCTNPSYTVITTNPGATNCLGVNLVTGDTSASILSRLLCANILDGGTLVQCSSFDFDIEVFADWTDFSGALPSLTFNASGTPVVNFNNGSAVLPSQVVAAMVGYRYYFFTPLIGCIFDPSDCAAGRKPFMVMTDFSAFRAEAFS